MAAHTGSSISGTAGSWSLCPSSLFLRLRTARNDYLFPISHNNAHLFAWKVFVARLALSELGFERAQAAETGRPGYDPRDLLKLYLYGYLNQIRSSRRLEVEWRRNIELMWLLGRLYPDHESISEFRRMHSEAVTAAGAALIRFARSCGLIRGEWIAIDGSKFRAVASIDTVRERVALQLKIMGAKPQPGERIVRSGKIVTAAGVSAGIDLALWLQVRLLVASRRKQFNWSSNMTHIHRSMPVT